MRLIKTISAILGILLALAGVVSVAAGGFALGVHRYQSGSSGYFLTPDQTLGSNGFALTVPDVNEQLTSGWQRWLLSRAEATIRVTGSSRLPAPVFIGVGPTAQVSEYLSGVARDRVTGIDLTGGSVEYEHVDGATVPRVPGDRSFWAAEVAGTGSRTLEWALRDGDWAMVIMNADASAPVAADVQLGARFGVVYPLIAGLAGVGVVLLALGATLVVIGVARRRDITPF